MKKIYSFIAVSAVAMSVNAQIVISQVYAHGGNTGATYKNDFVELFNKGAEPVTLEGAYLHYALGSGAFATNNTHSLPTITIPAGGYYLIKEGGSTSGNIDLPTADYTPATGINFGNNNGKIALTSTSAFPTAANSENVIDFIGYGTNASMSEGGSPVGAPNVTNSIFRKNNGCTDSNNNSADFLIAVVTPRNSQSAINDCATLGVSNFKNNREIIKNSVVFSDLYFNLSAKITIYNTAGQSVKIADVTKDNKLDLSALTKGIYIVKATVDGQEYSQKIIKK